MNESFLKPTLGNMAKDGLVATCNDRVRPRFDNAWGEEPSTKQAADVRLPTRLKAG
ncbi:hypothetical protein JANAI62_37080 [Jannaschia pagri]|uniref:Uncharacterized protein n=1 Tax=Jannaschia pagri TaxID=2829797 RepID=A0ABQ4NRN9_9RHOB|nr:hypothetical protein JANAI61_37060 [Jannaschia sp. AI_61]GIT97085.1 hypothetical protein JANAI62_37080 [Jannaschia sp. AI_62]